MIRIRKYRVDDLAHAKDPATEILADETVHLALDGEAWEIDLSKESHEKLMKKLDPYLKAGRRVRRRHRTRPVADRKRSAEIRAWARTRGLEVNDRGRIPAAIMAQYPGE